MTSGPRNFRHEDHGVFVSLHESVPVRCLLFAESERADSIPPEHIRLATRGKLRENREARDDVSRTGFKQPLAV